MRYLKKYSSYNNNNNVYSSKAMSKEDFDNILNLIYYGCNFEVEINQRGDLNDRN